MKEYNSKNKNEQYNRRNTSYYVKRFNIDDDFVAKYGIYTASVYKCRDYLQKISTDCPMFLEDMKEYIKDLQPKEQTNHVADLSGVEVLTELK